MKTNKVHLLFRLKVRPQNYMVPLQNKRKTETNRGPPLQNKGKYMKIITITVAFTALNLLFSVPKGVIDT